MTINEETNALIDELIKDEKDTAKLEKLAKMKKLHTKSIEEESKLLAKVGELTENYKTLILNMPVGKNAGEEDGKYKEPPQQVKDFADYFKEKAASLERK